MLARCHTATFSSPTRSVANFDSWLTLTGVDTVQPRRILCIEYLCRAGEAMPSTEDAADWLATAGTRMVPLGPTVVSAIPLDDGDLDEFLAAARRIRDAGLVAWVSRRPALRRGQKIDDPVGWRDLECVVETVGDC